MFDISVELKLNLIFLNGRWFVVTGPVSPDPGRDEDPAGRGGEPGGPDETPVGSGSPGGSTSPPR
jgi:hypothetical protein